MGTYVLVANGTEAGETFTFTLHAFNAAGTVAGAAAAWHTALGLLWNGVAPPTDSIKQNIPTTSSITSSSATEIDALTGKNLGQVITAEALVGTDATGPVPPQCCVVVSLRTAVFNKSGRGRFYLPAISTDKLTAGRITGTVVTQIVTASQKMIQSLNGAGYTVCVYHRGPRTHDNVVTINVGDVMDTQRRRRDKLVEVRTSLSV
jgi:hypothetical protein